MLLPSYMSYIYIENVKTLQRLLTDFNICFTKKVNSIEIWITQLKFRSYFFK